LEKDLGETEEGGMKAVFPSDCCIVPIDRREYICQIGLPNEAGDEMRLTIQHYAAT
jgi:hypothetical protein